MDSDLIGGTLAHYRILARLGSGGMGEVFLAEDTKLDRKIALKVLPVEMAENPERRSRFEREAKAVAALNHPNIVTIHSVEEAEGVHFITMELVEGRTLSDLIAGKAMALARIFELTVPVAEAVSAAHAQGITHRDLKPDNIMVGADGRPKILDFGLAKLREPEPGEHDATLLTRSVTEEGKILGTVAYMSPEQAEGKPVDHRTDIFSLGIILYEMATGAQPFDGDTRISVITSILRDTPASITELNRSLPRHLGRVVKRCLAKEPDRRYQTALDLRNELEELKAELDSGETAAGVAPGVTLGRRGKPGLVAGLVVVTIVAVAAALWMWRSGSNDDTSGRAVLGTFIQLTTAPGQELFPSLSPDGRDFVYVSKSDGDWDVYLQRVGGENPINLTPDSDVDESQPAFSPDGDFIAFARVKVPGGIFVMGATGESVRRLTDFGYNPAWSPDGAEIVFATEGVYFAPGGRNSISELWVVDVASGETHKIHDGDAVQPHWSPSGERIAFWGLAVGGGQRDLWTLPAEGGEARAVTEDAPLDWNPVWSPDGRYLYFSSDRGGSLNLWRLPIDQQSGEILGEPQAVTSGVGEEAGHPSLTADGRLAYAVHTVRMNLQGVEFDPATATVNGEPAFVTRGSSVDFWPDVSPDGQWLAYRSGTPFDDIFISRVDGSGRRQLTHDEAKDRLPAWSPDGKEIAFYSDRSGSYDIWSIRPDGSNLRQLTNTPGRDTIYGEWSHDGAELFFNFAMDGEVAALRFANGTIRTLPRPDDARWAMTAVSPGGEFLAGHDLDGGGIIVLSVESGEFERLTDTGAFPRWLRDNRRMVYQDRDELRTVDRETGEVRSILSVRPDSITARVAPTPDNTRLYFARQMSDADVWLLTLE